MCDMILKLREDWFENCIQPTIIEMGDDFDVMWGTDCVELSLDDIQALMQGKVLTWDNGEYATVVRLKQEVTKQNE